jgi:hypothetical protein
LGHAQRVGPFFPYRQNELIKNLTIDKKDLKLFIEKYYYDLCELVWKLPYDSYYPVGGLSQLYK